MRVAGHDWLYAIGDVNGRALLTHMGKYQGRLCADHVAGEEVEAVADRYGVPQIVFTEPQVGAVGKSLDEAREAGIDARAVDVESSMTAGASFVGKDVPGTSRIVVDESRRVIVGATFVGRRDRRVATCGDDRGPRRGAARPPLARRALLPQPQRGLAQADGGVRALDAGRSLDRQVALQLVEERPGEARDLVELVERGEAAGAFAVREDAAGLGHRQLQAAQIVVIGLVDVDRAAGGRLDRSGVLALGA